MNFPSLKQPTNVHEFLASQHRNLWLNDDTMDVYVRKGYHSILGKIYLCFDIANVFVKEKHRRKGVFRRWLVDVEHKARRAGIFAVYVEAIQNPHLAEFLLSVGYTASPGEFCSMYKVLSPVETQTPNHQSVFTVCNPNSKGIL